MFRSLGANIWDYEIPIRFGGIPLWHRMTVIRLINGDLVIHSPTKLDLASQEEFQTSLWTNEIDQVHVQGIGLFLTRSYSIPITSACARPWSGYLIGTSIRSLLDTVPSSRTTGRKFPRGVSLAVEIIGAVNKRLTAPRTVALALLSKLALGSGLPVAPRWRLARRVQHKG